MTLALKFKTEASQTNLPKAHTDRGPERRASRQIEASTKQANTHFSNGEVVRDRYTRPLQRTERLHGPRRASDATAPQNNLVLLFYTSTHEKSNLRRPQRSKP